MLEHEHIDRRRTALIAYDVCRRALAPSDAARRAAMRPVLDAWVQMIAAARAAADGGLLAVGVLLTRVSTRSAVSRSVSRVATVARSVWRRASPHFSKG